MYSINYWKTLSTIAFGQSWIMQTVPIYNVKLNDWLPISILDLCRNNENESQNFICHGIFIFMLEAIIEMQVYLLLFLSYSFSQQIMTECLLRIRQRSRQTLSLPLSDRFLRSVLDYICIIRVTFQI